jgi:hypothetical protein
MATAFEVASGFARWALSRNLIPALPGAIEDEYLAMTQPLAIRPVAEDILRRRGVSSIVFNDGDAAVYIYTTRKVTQKELDELPIVLHDCSVSYPHGAIDDLIAPNCVAQASPYTISVSPSGGHHYACGSSISPGNEESAGTLGALVRDAAGVMYGLTNNHVTGGCNHSPAGLPILAPGVVDVGPGGLSPFTIGHHSRVLPYVLGTGGNVNIRDNTDAAIFQIADESSVTSMQGREFDTPALVADPIERMRVGKVGRTTGYTEGVIIGRELRPVGVKASSTKNSFSGNIWFPSVWLVHGDGREFSAAGDSGSLVVSLNPDGTRSAVGLVFCGGPDSMAPGNAKTYVVPLAPILQRLNVSLVSGHNATP